MIRRIPGVAAVAVALLGSVCVADEKPSPPAAWRADLAPRVEFYRELLLPRMERQLRDQLPMHLVAAPGQSITDDLLYGDLARATRRSVERAASRALEDYLSEDLSLGRVGGFGSSATRRSAAGSTRFDVRVSHALPALGLRHSTGAGDLRISVNAYGGVSLGFSAPGFNGARLRASYDPADGEYHLTCRLSF